ncbi:serine/threonine-protein phosphatase 6 regulatory subunit 3-like [Malaclemys terrapin pileata]|uniref:serine/threonine-protein phosphatase 6 regulatory subunit 3-like n=1 Tax=Malaclemys terrapin pileata TaxID=2991368 RepID=UPI0023A7F765|nr:serine/threonine-protein phosphatase 6 regulatory subunit 3-like [Malaclemys terrapin pileata]
MSLVRHRSMETKGTAPPGSPEESSSSESEVEPCAEPKGHCQYLSYIPLVLGVFKPAPILLPGSDQEAKENHEGKIPHFPSPVNTGGPAGSAGDPDTTSAAHTSSGSTLVKRDFPHENLLAQEVEGLLQLGAMEEVPHEYRNKGFYSQYYLIPKARGGLRPILDLQDLSKYLKKLKFHMVSLTSIIPSLDPGDWYATLDLKDMYFHTAIFQAHRHFLHFTVGSDHYQFAVLPFGDKKSVMKTTWGILDPSVGNIRLNVIRLISSLLQTNTNNVNLELMELNSIGVRLDMFFKYTWNNFLHTQVEICIALILASPLESTENGTITDQDSIGDSLLLKHLFLKCQLVERILEAWEMNEKKQAEGGRQHGYMGHLTRIANCIVHSTDKGPNSALVQQLLKLPDDVRERWETFCTNSLGETNKRNTVDLVTTCHIHSSSDDEIDFKETVFSQDSSLQQAFSDYQMQQMTSNFIDQFGFNDEKFADQDDIGNVSFDRVSDINFTLNTNESPKEVLLWRPVQMEKMMWKMQTR